MTKVKRKLFYLGGFDPRGTRYYYGLLAEQLKKLEKSENLEIEIGPRSFGNPAFSTTRITNASEGVETDYVFLRWEDFVSAVWTRNPFRLLLEAIKTYAAFFRHSEFARARRLGRGQLVTLMLPFIVMIALPIVVFVASLAVAAALLPLIWALLAALVVSLAVSIPCMIVFHSPWLLRFFIFNNRLARGRWPPGLQARLDDFANQIAAAEGYDEVLFVTHSNGSILAIPVLDRLRTLWGGAAPSNFALITLGQCIPLLALRRDATAFTRQLRDLAAFDVRWVDIGSPPDGAAFHGVDPLLLASPSHRARIDLLSPRFHLFYDPANYHRGYRNKFEVHFDYLRTGDRASPLDLPSLAAGPLTIEQAVAAFKAID